MPENELIIVSNRCPISNLKKGAESISIGGLTSTLHQVAMEQNSTWVFVTDPGNYEYIHSGEKVPGINYKFHPVKFQDKVHKGFYEGYSNSTIWPLFHYFPGKCIFNDTDWSHYQEVNESIANNIAQIVKDKPDALIWVQDYHLFLVASYLRKLGVINRIGFFLHIPFPTYEIFRILPQRTKLLNALLDYDLLGFHTKSYVSNFRRSIRRLIDQNLAPTGTNLIERGGHASSIQDFPISVDTEYITRLNNDDATRKYSKVLRSKITQQFIGIGVDRLDYSKGILQKLKALDLFFKHNPKYRGKLCFIQIAVPSRSQVTEYENIKKQIEERVSRINGQYGDLNWQPIIYINRSVPFSTLISYYQIADFAMVTPLRDGMNLVAKEFLLCKKKNATLILSELAGVAEELGELDLVNPYNINEMAESIRRSLDSSCKQNEIIDNYLTKLGQYDVHTWTRNFLDKLSVVDKSSTLKDNESTKTNEEAFAKRI